MLLELEQCSCGILFAVPIFYDDAFQTHRQNRTHDRCLGISICGPCFFGAHHGCEQRRKSRAWQCTCTHADIPSVTVDADRLSEMTIDWSNWLAAGRPSGFINSQS